MNKWKRLSRPPTPGFTQAMLRHDVPLVRDKATLRRIEALFSKFFRAEDQLDFHALKRRGDLVVVVMSLSSDWMHKFIAGMRAKGTEHIYVAEYFSDYELHPEHVTEIPLNYDRDKYGSLFSGISSGDWLGLIDGDGRYCCYGVQSFFGYLIVPAEGGHSFFDDNIWKDYYDFREDVMDNDFGDADFCRVWPEIVAARDALLAVDQYWRETGFTPPPRSELFKR
ncbi:MAG: hypothetical protein ACPG06_07570 [Alphaproteobacteria bacterium]